MPWTNVHVVFPEALELIVERVLLWKHNLCNSLATNSSQGPRLCLLESDFEILQRPCFTYQHIRQAGLQGSLTVGIAKDTLLHVPHGSSLTVYEEYLSHARPASPYPLLPSGRFQ